MVQALPESVAGQKAVWASIKLAEEHPDAVIVCIICDRGDRYLSTGLFSVQDPE